MSEVLNTIRNCCRVVLCRNAVSDAERIAGQITTEVTRELGGETLYIPRIDRESRDAVIHSCRASGYSLDEIAERAGCARATVRSVLRTGKKSYGFCTTQSSMIAT